MLKTIASIASALLFGASLAHAQAPAKIDLLTENFPPYNMAADGKNFARDENISGIAVDIVREMFKRAGVDYTLTLRFPGSASTAWRWSRPTTGCSSPRGCPSVKSCSVGRPHRPGRLGAAGPWRQSDQPDQPGPARQYTVGAYKGDAIAEHRRARVCSRCLPCVIRRT